MCKYRPFIKIFFIFLSVLQGVFLFHFFYSFWFFLVLYFLVQFILSFLLIFISVLLWFFSANSKQNRFKESLEISFQTLVKKDLEKIILYPFNKSLIIIMIYHNYLHEVQFLLYLQGLDCIHYNGVKSTPKCESPGHETIFRDVQGLWGLWSTSSLSLLSCPLWPGVVVLLGAPSKGPIVRFENY